MNAPEYLSLFQAFGVELEYMIVSDDTLAVRPIADQVLHAVAGRYDSEVELGEIAWSNELALHVIELKTNGPTADLAELPGRFGEHVRRINHLLQAHGARLMPTAMHPWMDPHQELKLWPHEYNAVYEAFNRVFDCRGHGWANLQSVHLNLPFADDDEFGRLHAAIRLVLPLLPALAASSPIIEGQSTQICDTRLHVYRSNAAAIPAVTGAVVPEAVYTQRDYQRHILEPMYRAIAAYDPHRTLQYEWLNARGAIARFDRHTIEIRVLDIQECPAADLAICAATIGVLRALVDQQWSSLAQQQAMDSGPLVDVLTQVIREADQAVVQHPDYLRIFGLDHPRPLSARQLWEYLLEQTAELQPGGPATWRPALQTIIQHGPLARRIARHGQEGWTPDRLQETYRRLCDCLEQGTQFV